MSLYVPKSGSVRHRIVQFLLEGPLTLPQIRECFPSERASMIQEAVWYMESHEAIQNTASGYTLSRALRKFYDDASSTEPEYVPQIVGPRYRPEFREISADKLPHLNSLIRGRLRDSARLRSFPTCRFLTSGSYERSGHQ